MLSDGPKPHVGGKILAHLLSPGQHLVYIGQSTLAATEGDPCFCASPTPNEIAQGSATVRINNRPATRLFDKTKHGGFITSGEGTVLIGEYAAVAATIVFPGIQHHGNCAIQCCEQIVRHRMGTHRAEDDLLNFALANNYAIRDKKPEKNGGMMPDKIKDLLANANIASTVYYLPQGPLLAQLIKEKKGIIANLDADTLWGTPLPKRVPEGRGHSVLITEGEYDVNGRWTHVYINDTGVGHQGRRVPIKLLKDAFLNFKNNYGNPSYSIVATDLPLWDKFPSSPTPQVP